MSFLIIFRLLINYSTNIRQLIYKSQTFGKLFYKKNYMAELSPREKGINNRFLEAYTKLKGLKRFRFKKDFCLALDMPNEYFSHFEKETRPVPSQYIDKISEVFGISKKWIEDDEGEMFAESQEKRKKSRPLPRRKEASPSTPSLSMTSTSTRATYSG